jgi:hypothetical protein
MSTIVDGLDSPCECSGLEAIGRAPVAAMLRFWPLSAVSEGYEIDLKKVRTTKLNRF